MSEESFEQFRQLVLDDRGLQEELKNTDDNQAFPGLVVSLGKDRGYTFTSEDVEAALRTNRRAWLERAIR